MKKLLALVLLACIALTLVACGEPAAPAEKDYTLSVAVDSAFDSDDQEQSNVACAIVFDKDGKIVKAAFDSFATKFGYNNGALVTIERIQTKYEQGENYGGTAVPEYIQMASGSWQKQADAFVKAIVGKTVAEVKAMDATLIAGCTMPTTTPIFQTLVEKAYNYERKVSFKTADDIKLGFDVEAKLDGTASSAEVAADYAAIVFAANKSVAAMLDSSANEYTLAVNGDKFVATPGEYKGTKNEQGDAYDAWEPMPGGRWYAQAQAFADETVGKTAAEMETIDAASVSGCTIYAGGYKTALIAAAAKSK